jgi:hypothetical protein
MKRFLDYFVIKFAYTNDVYLDSHINDCINKLVSKYKKYDDKGITYSMENISAVIDRIDHYFHLIVLHNNKIPNVQQESIRKEGNKTFLPDRGYEKTFIDILWQDEKAVNFYSYGMPFPVTINIKDFFLKWTDFATSNMKDFFDNNCNFWKEKVKKIDPLITFVNDNKSMFVQIFLQDCIQNYCQSVSNFVIYQIKDCDFKSVPDIFKKLENGNHSLNLYNKKYAISSIADKQLLTNVSDSMDDDKDDDGEYFDRELDSFVEFLKNDSTK